MPHPLDTCELCNIPKPPEGFTALAKYTFNGSKGIGAGTSIVSQAEADQRALDNAIRAALTKQGFYGATLL